MTVHLRWLVLCCLLTALVGASRGSPDAWRAKVEALAALQAEELLAAATTLPPTEGSIAAELRARIADLVAELDPDAPGRAALRDRELRPMTESEATADAQRRANRIAGMPGPSNDPSVLQPHELRSMAVEMAREQLALAADLLPHRAYRAEYAARQRALELATTFVASLPEGDDEGIALALAIDQAREARFEPWTGRWNSPWGEIELARRGGTLVGRNHSGGGLQGRVKDTEAKGDFRFGAVAGSFTMTMDPRGGRIRLRTRGDEVTDLRFLRRIGDLEPREATE